MAYQVRQFINHRCLMVFNPAVSGARMPLIRPFNTAKPYGNYPELWKRENEGQSYLSDLTALQGNAPVRATNGGE